MGLQLATPAHKIPLGTNFETGTDPALPLGPWKVAKWSKTRWKTGHLWRPRTPLCFGVLYNPWKQSQEIVSIVIMVGDGPIIQQAGLSILNTLYQKCTKMVKFVILFLSCTSSHQLLHQRQSGRVLSSRVDFGSEAIRDPTKGNKHPSRDTAQVYVHQQGTQPTPG